MCTEKYIIAKMLCEEPIYLVESLEDCDVWCTDTKYAKEFNDWFVSAVLAEEFRAVVLTIGSVIRSV